MNFIKEKFNFNICAALIKHEYYELRSEILWLSITIFFVLSFIAGFAQNNYLYGEINTHGSVVQIYSIAGITIASISFWELKNSLVSKEYLLLPASIFEKVATKAAIYIIGWFLLVVILWIAANILAGIVGVLITHSSLLAIYYTCLNGLRAVLFSLKTVALIQMIVIFANCYLRKKVLLKLMVIYGVIVLPLTSIINHEISGLMTHFNENIRQVLINVWPGVEFIFGLLGFLLAFCLTWLRLKETEVN